MTAFTVATVAGLPAALELSRLGGWRSTFFALAALGLVVAGRAIFLMPSLRLHLNHEKPTVAHGPPWFRRLGEHQPTVFALLASFSAMAASFAMIPNISSYVQGNLRYPRADLGLLFLAGGLSSFVAMRVMGPVIDRVGSAFTAALGTAVFVPGQGAVKTSISLSCLVSKSPFCSAIGIVVHWYLCTKHGANVAKPRPKLAEPNAEAPARRTIERVQTGVRIEQRLLHVLKALADVHGISLGDLLEGIVLHAFEGKAPFSAASLEKIAALKQVFGLDLTAADSHLLVERSGRRTRARPA